MRPDRRSLLHLLWPSVGPTYEQGFDAELHVETGAQSAKWLLPRLRRFENAWSPPDVPGLPVESQAVDESGTAVEFYWVGSGARIAGTLVHRWAQLAADGHVSLQDITVDALRNPGTRWLREMGINDAAGEAILQRATTALHSMAEDDRGRWLIDGDGHAELALSGVVNGQLESVILDRVRIDDDGIHWIVATDRNWRSTLRSTATIRTRMFAAHCIFRCCRSSSRSTCNAYSWPSRRNSYWPRSSGVPRNRICSRRFAGVASFGATCAINW